jgi:hypothetical protein
VGNIGADHVIEQHTAEMRGRARAGGTERHLVLVRLGIGDEFAEIFRRQVLLHGEDDRHLGDQRNRGEVRGRIVLRPLVHGLVLGMRADRAEDHGVAVGLGLRDARGTRHAAGAADILDDHLLAENFAHPLRHHAAKNVGRSAGGERDDHCQRSGRRPVLRACAAERQQGQHGTQQTLQHGDLLTKVAQSRPPCGCGQGQASET